MDSDFIWKVRKLRGWRARALKTHLEKAQNSGFFYVRRRWRREGFEVRRN